MSPITKIWSQLAQRRLWPVAILLVAALVAVPLALSKTPATAPAPPAPSAGADDGGVLAEQPIVADVSTAQARRRRVLGTRKDPFARRLPAVQAGGRRIVNRSQTPSQPASNGPSGGSSAPSAPSTPPSYSAPPPVGPPALAPAKPTYELYSLTVRFGDATSEDLPKMNLARLKALPSAEEPVLIYLGLAEDTKTAIFMVDSNVVPQGDGTCKPSPSNCETIHLRKGDTEFFDVTDEDGSVSAQYELDLIDIKRSKTASASKARRAYARESKAGRKALRARMSVSGPLRYRYDYRRGTVERLGAKAWKAVVAKAAKAVKATL